jgi:exosome complex exonuclease DIS3/RRP44
MLRQRSFIRKTRKGHVIKIVREHYLRDDIYCGSMMCRKCGQQEFKLTQPESGHYLILDTNVILQQIDLLDNPALKNVIIPQTVLEEVRHRSRSVHERIRAIIADADRHFFVFYNELRRCAPPPRLHQLALLPIRLDFSNRDWHLIPSSRTQQGDFH